MALILYAALALSYAFYLAFKRWRRISVKRIPGPPSASFLYGNMPELIQSQVGEVEFKWQAKYGHVVRVAAPFGEDILLISDPKALQYIYHTSSYHFPKSKERVTLGKVVNGYSVLAAEGDDHRRQRRLMLPGFGAPEMRALVPIFSTYITKLSSIWIDMIESSSEGNGTITVDIPPWLSRATLDSIGEAAFDYQFDTLTNSNDPLAKTYLNLITDTFGSPTHKVILFQGIAKRLPQRFVEWLLFYVFGNSKRLAHAFETRKITAGVAKMLIKQKKDAIAGGFGAVKKDVMSLLVQGNQQEGLSDEEFVSQLRVLLIAGHETTGTTLTWLLFELTKSPRIQTNLRNEIRNAKAKVTQRGGEGFGWQDFESMPYLNAVIKESLRFNPAVIHMFRMAGADDVIPLQYPILTTTGETIHELAIPAGQNIIASIAGYNRNKDLFGHDAGEFRPERWLEKRDDGGDTTKKVKNPALGVYANLFTFSGGSRSCIGWRFALLEIQTFLVELIDKFEFALTPEAEKIRKENCIVMAPTIEGQIDKGSQMPLRVKVAGGASL